MDVIEQVEMLLECGYDVMLHARTDGSQERAERWFIEIARYPLAVSHADEGPLEQALERAAERYFAARAEQYDEESVDESPEIW